MPRMQRKPKTSKSEHWMRFAVEHNSDIFNTKVKEVFDFSCDEEIEWFSPLVADAYAEYRDEAFLNRLGLGAASSSLRSFWPSKGPQWDGLARTKSGKYILVEAKAHEDEAKSICTATSPASLGKIAESLAKTQFISGWHH